MQRDRSKSFLIGSGLLFLAIYPFWYSMVFPRSALAGILQAIIPAAVPTANKRGNGTRFQLGTGTPTAGHCAEFDADLNIIDSGVSGCTGSGGAGTTFDNITSGVNTSGSTLTVGNTSTLTFSGTGVVNANQIASTTVAASSAADQALRTSASGVSSWTGVPNCTTGLTYNTSTHAFGCVAVSAGLVLVEQHTASTSAALNFTTCITSTYDDYLLEFVNILPATDAVEIRIQGSTDGGANYDTGTNYAWATTFTLSSAGGGNEGNSADTGIQISPGQEDSDSTWGGVSGFVKLHNPANAVGYKHVEGNYVGKDNRDAVMVRRTVGGMWKTSSDMDAFRIIASSGDLASGTARCYGYAK